MKALKIFAVAALAIILAASNAAKSAATEAITKIASSKAGANTVSNAKEITSAASTLSTLFKNLKK